MTNTAPMQLAAARAAFATGRTRRLDWRLGQLNRLEQLLRLEADAILAALFEDLGRSRTEGLLSEVYAVRREVDELRRGLRRWSRTEQVRLPLVLQPARAAIFREPLGVVLVIGPWNYPINLMLVPLAAAIAAGNAVILKPSEHAPASSALIADLAARYLDTEAVRVVEGDASVSEALIDAGVDHVLFTGSAKVGRLVMARAAAHLTPVTLELGGKSPAVVDSDADLEVAARRIAWGKFMNAGQSCIAPDYVLVHKSVKERLLSELTGAIRRLYGREPKDSPDFGRIVNDTHVHRLAGLLENHGGKVLVGGDVEHASGYVAPTVIDEPSPSSALMQEEIFGPILPVLSIADLEQAASFLAKRPAPLTLYLFSKDRSKARHLIEATRSGSVAINTTMEQFVSSRLPFGGVGESGMGVYHGRYGFATFSQLRPVLEKATRPDPSFAYPPFGAWRARLLRRALLSAPDLFRRHH